MFKQILTTIPHDAAAVVAYALMAGFVVFIWWGTRKSGKE